MCVEHVHGSGDHDHDEHVHEGAAGPDDLTPLRILLPHWLEHNEEHAKSFHEWAARARAAGAEHLAVHIEEAASKIEAANRNLEGALEHIGAATNDHDHLDHQHPHGGTANT